MTFFINHPYITTIMTILILNSSIKVITKSEYSPLAKLTVLLFTLIGQACSPFSGPVDEKKSDAYYYSRSKEYIQYSPMGNWFELGNTRMEADVESFVVLGNSFGKDKDHVYYQHHIIDDEIDKASFYVEEFICFDKNRVYIPQRYGIEIDKKERYMLVVEGANPKTYKEIDYSWARDDQHYFYQNVMVDVDYNTFEIINTKFASDMNQVYLIKTNQLKKSFIDAASAKKLDERYLLDKNNIYDFKEYIDGQEVDSLISIHYDHPDEIKVLEEEYLVLHNSVYYDGQEIQAADASTFRLLESKEYARDNHSIYYFGEIIKEADLSSFQIMEYSFYAKDRNHVYGNGKVINAADPVTFGPVGDKNSLLYKDKNHTYRGGEVDK